MHKPSILLLLLLALLLGACLTAEPPTPTPFTTQAIYTAAAQTIAAQLTLDAGGTAVALLTALAEVPAATPTPPPTSTPTPAPSETPQPSASATPAPTAPPCDQGIWVNEPADSSPALFLPGGSFYHAWRIQNTGQCTWNRSYALVFESGDPLADDLTFPLPGSIAPGQLLELVVPMRAPGTAGEYEGAWRLRNAAGMLFASSAAGGPLRVHIRVLQPAARFSASYDLAADFCSASWQSSSGPLDCPGSIAGTLERVTLVERPRLEIRNEAQPALLTQPGLLLNAWLSGQYPAYLVLSGDRFLAEVGCLAGSTGCDVTFRLDYMSNTGLVTNLGVWEEFFDGDTTQIDIDLSYLAGRSIQPVLSVTNNNPLGTPGAFWLRPRIQNGYLESDLVLDWNQQDTNDTECSELVIYRTGTTSGEAVAVNCQSRPRSTRSGTLTRAEMNAMLDWLGRLRSFDGEFYTAAGGRRAWFSFSGHGSSDASPADIQAIQTLAQRIFNRLAP